MSTPFRLDLILNLRYEALRNDGAQRTSSYDKHQNDAGAEVGEGIKLSLFRSFQLQVTHQGTFSSIFEQLLVEHLLFPPVRFQRQLLILLVL